MKYVAYCSIHREDYDARVGCEKCHKRYRKRKK